MRLRLICPGLSYLPRSSEAENSSECYRLPRISMAQTNQQFLPDYTLLLLADEIVMDERTYEGLIRGEIQAGPTVSLMAKLLREEGLIHLEDFEAARHKQRSLVKARVAAGLGQAEAWIPAMRESVQIWQIFYDEIQLTLRPRIQQLRQALAAGKKLTLDYSRQGSSFLHDLGGRFQMEKYYADEALPPEGKPPEGETLKALESYLGEQLDYVVTNLQFCARFNAGLHDWCDFRPFYQQAMAGDGEIPVDPQSGHSTRLLFSVPLPEFIFWHPDKVICALKSKRVQKLRDAVRESVFKHAAFDEKTAMKILEAIGHLDKGVNNIRLVTAACTSGPHGSHHLQLISQAS